jgi:dinuclear metal center YbgI/SA1388 family protein
MEALATITSFLNRELKPDLFKDSSHNGLQVQNSGRIKRVCCGVDASMDFFKAAHANGANLLICHHGISWGDSLAHITELNYERLKFLLAHDIALYAAHLPLDAHPLYGNNACMAKSIGLRALKPFGNYHGQHIGYSGALPKAIAYSSLKGKLASLLDNDKIQSMDFGKDRIRSVAVVSGGASDLVAEAAQAGIDVYVTGEPTLAAYSVAAEYGINVIYGGHYATETFGVKAIGNLLSKHFSIDTEFIDLGVPF